MTTLLAALFLLSVAALASVVDVRLAIRAGHTADLMRDTAGMTRDTTQVQSDTAGVTPDAPGVT
jgi:hypothetical protein